MKERLVLEKFDTQELNGVMFDIYGDFTHPLFLAKDVADFIEHNKPHEMIKNIEDGVEKLMATVSLSGQNRDAWFLTEDGVYEVLMTSRKPKAKEFKKFVKTLLKEYRLKRDLSVIEVFDIKHQKSAMDRIKNLEENYMISNIKVNEILGEIVGVGCAINKKDIKKFQSQTTIDLLEVREVILDKFINALELTGSKREAKEITLRFALRKYKINK